MSDPTSTPNAPELSGYIEDPGIAPRGELQPDSEISVDQEQGELAAAPEAAWEEAQLRAWLSGVGSVAHEAWGIAEADWALTEKDLARIAPSLTRILNRYERTRSAAVAADPLQVGAGFMLYGWRSAIERARELRRRREEQSAQRPGGHPGIEIQPPPEAPHGHT